MRKMSNEKVFVTKYRGFDIHIETEDGTFSVSGDDWQDARDRKSLKACYTFIDQYIKDNETFKPIEAMKIAGFGKIGDIVRFTGMRKDGRLIFENGDQLSRYHEKEYLIIGENNHDKASEVIGEIRSVNNKVADLQSERMDLERSLASLGTNLVDHLKELRADRQ